MPNPSNIQSSASVITPELDWHDPTVKLVQSIAQAADERKGGDITILRVTDVSPLADYFVIVTGFSKVQVRAIANSIEEKAAADWQRKPRKSEGLGEGTWVLQDFGDVVVHIQMPHEREFYNLEAFWGHADRIPVSALVH